MVITSEYWDTAKAFFFSVFTRLMSAWSGFLPSRFCLVDTWFSLIDSKEVTVHWPHGNTVVNHTFVCFDGWYFNSPEASFLALLLVVIDDWRLSSIKTDIWYKRSFLSIAGAKVRKKRPICKSAPVTWTNFFSLGKRGDVLDWKSGHKGQCHCWSKSFGGWVKKPIV